METLSKDHPAPRWQNMDFLSTIIKTQNYRLLVQMCDAYGWDKDKILKKYWTPTFYVVTDPSIQKK